MTDPFPPTLAGAAARIAAVDPVAYARSRNAIEGAVSGLSPYLTHGFIRIAEVIAGVRRNHRLDAQHKFVFELGWRAYFRHIWAHRGRDIFASLHAGPQPEAVYTRELPEDIRQARTGLPVIDQSVRALYATGMLHNHARMWLSSYVVHLRKVHWRIGADWMYAHLLDGDLASNHLSWQWVAGTGSHKPYLFNADNVARYAPRAWHCPGTVLDADYPALEAIARSPRRVPAATCPPTCDVPLPSCEPVLLDRPPPDLPWGKPDPALVRGREVWLIHPWSLGSLPAGLGENALVIGVALADFHRDWPWSERRWRFVSTRMAELTPHLWMMDAGGLAELSALATRTRCVADPHLSMPLSDRIETLTEPDFFPMVPTRCDAFSRWWTRVIRTLPD